MVLTEVIEGYLHRPVALELLLAFGREASTGKVGSPIRWNFTAKILHLAYGVDYILGGVCKNRVYYEHKWLMKIEQKWLRLNTLNCPNR